MTAASIWSNCLFYGNKDISGNPFFFLKSISLSLKSNIMKKENIELIPFPVLIKIASELNK